MTGIMLVAHVNPGARYERTRRVYSVDGISPTVTHGGQGAWNLIKILILETSA